MPLTPFEVAVLDQLDQLTTNMAKVQGTVEDMKGRLFGNGQPGEIASLWGHVGSLETSRAKVWGAVAVLSGLLGLATIVLKFWRH